MARQAVRMCTPNISNDIIVLPRSTKDDKLEPIH